MSNYYRPAIRIINEELFRLHNKLPHIDEYATTIIKKEMDVLVEAREILEKAGKEKPWNG